ncbi:serine proteinase [Intestinimonas massiliensis (ex Afouda et al. 2020)]|uniref:serine proteinase n=1 Tax=Intestinimonas massiliensis (ex Afouda et al. 2020) TaxID=1673721 RepID=UPI00102F830E|nr:serine proteinase [Intestinimonas massiliensis (ex Afouda et al. 2020)]
MAFFDELKDRAIDLGRAGVAKSKQLAEITRLSLNNASEEDAIRKAYIEIGKLYYAERGMAAEPAYVALCERITSAKINIEENKNRIAAIKQEGNISDAEAATYVETNVPPEEPVAGDAPSGSEDVPPQE